MKKIMSIVYATMLAVFALATPASADFEAPDMSGVIADMGTAFTAVLLLVVTFLGFKYIKRMFG